MIIPIFAGLERIPGSLLEASADLGGRAGTTFRRVVLPLALPAIAAGSIFTFSLTLGDYITPDARLEHPVHRQRGLRLRGRRRQPAAGRGLRDGPGHDHAGLPARRAPPRRVRGALMTVPRGVRICLRIASALLLAFIYLPIGIIVLYSFNAARVATWPIGALTRRLVRSRDRRRGDPIGAAGLARGGGRRDDRRRSCSVR